MALGILESIRNSMLTQIVNAIDAGAGAGKLRIYDGSRPATGGATTTLLAEITLNDPSFTVTGGVATMDVTPEPSDTSADAGGTASWFRLVDSNNAFVLDGNVGTAGSDLNLTTTTIVAGQPVTITSFTITAGNP